MDPYELLLTAGRATLVYFFMLAVVRLLGKRSIGALSAFDLLVALMLGEVVDEIIYGDVTLIKGFLVVVVIVIWHAANEWASFKHKGIARLTESSPTLLIKNGVIDRQALAGERLSEDELRSQLRLLNIEDVSEVETAYLEPSGHVSVIRAEASRPLQKRDLAAAGSARKAG